MTIFLVRPRDRIFVNGYEFLSFAKEMSRNICKNISENLSSKHRQKFLDHGKQYAAEATGDLIGNKIAGRIKKISKTSPQNNSETNEKEILIERHISPEQGELITDDLKLI